MDRYLSLLQRLVEIESPSGDAAGIGAVANVIAAEAGRLEGRVERIGVGELGEHLSIRFFDNGGGREPLLVMTHMDTVHPVGTLARIPFRRDGGRLGGPGVYDMKGGIAAALEAVERMRENGNAPAGPVHLLVTCDEEIGSGSSRDLIERSARAARATLVLEPCVPGGLAKTARKGVAGYDVEIRGKPAHAGIEPEAGASAVHEMAAFIRYMVERADPEAGTTVNIGTVAGGTASNVVAERAKAVVDVRFWTRAEADRLDSAVRAFKPSDARCSIHVEGGINRYALEETEASRALFERARLEAEHVGFDLRAGRTGGASDGNFASAVGCPTLDGLGPDGGGAHSMEEHVLLDALPTRLDLITRLMAVL